MMLIEKPTNFVDFIIVERRDLNWNDAYFLFKNDPKKVLTRKVSILIYISTKTNLNKYLTWNALHICVFRGAPAKLIQELALSSSTLLNEPDKFGRTPLHFACTNYRPFDLPYKDWQSRKDIIRVLLSCGADANLKTKNGETALDLLIEAECRDQEVFKLLISQIKSREIEKYQREISGTNLLLEEFLVQRGQSKSHKLQANVNRFQLFFRHCFCFDEE